VRLLSLVVTIALAYATFQLASLLSEFQPLEHWLGFRYLRAWGCVALFVLACLSSGNLIVSALSRPGEQQDGHVTLSFATGVVAFATTIFAVGLLGGLGKVAFFGVPLGLFLVGAPRLYRDLLSYRARAAGRPSVEPFSLPEALVFGGGAIALAVLYLPILVPENASYDARWYHMGLADHYAAGGAIARMPEGVLVASIPQLASYLYTWAYLEPNVQLFDRVELCAHLEFTVFLFTLAGIPVLVRYLVPGVRARTAWVALFLFPSVFVYDHTLLIGADHIATLWSIPVYLVTARALREFDAKTGLLLAIQISGLLLCKYTALTAAVFPAIFLPFRCAWLLVEHLRGRRRDLGWLLGLGTLLGAGLVLTSQHWLKNWIWYGDPFYPLLHRHLNVRPWTAQSEFYLEAFRSLAWEAQGTTKEKFEGALKAMQDYHHELYGWEVFHHRHPVVGSLFYFGLFVLPFLRKTARLWTLVVAAELGIAVWFLLFHDTRYLRPLIPLMTAGIVALGIGCWRLGWGPRAGVVSLAGVQLLYGLGIIFWPAHQMTPGKSGIEAAADFFARGFTAPETDRTPTYVEWASIGRGLPKSSVLLLHHEHLRAGIGLRTVTDWLPVQMGIDYGAIGSLRGVHKKLKELGVTHATWATATAYADTSLASELLFHTYVSRFTVDKSRVGSRTVAELPRRAPPEDDKRVFYFGCDGTYASGLYELRDLAVSPLPVPKHTAKYPRPRTKLVEPASSLLDQASYAVIVRACPGAPEKMETFEVVAKNTTTDFMARK